MMRSYKIKSYVPEKNFLSGKDARFCRAAFADCFVIDVNNKMKVIASSCEEKKLVFSMVDVATILTLFEGKKKFRILPHPLGTLVVYPAWQYLGLALAFLFQESTEEVEKAYQNAEQYAFSNVFQPGEKRENLPVAELETKLCTLSFYMNHIFGAERQSNVTAQILMIANLMGCHLHETCVSHVTLTLDEREVERLGAYLCCTFMTMRRYNGRISTAEKNDQNTAFSTHVLQKYSICIQQSIKERLTKPSMFDLPTRADVADFATHPAFADYRIEETDGTVRMHLPIKQKSFLSSLSAQGGEQEIILTLFPF